MEEDEIMEAVKKINRKCDLLFTGYGNLGASNIIVQQQA